VLAGYVVLVEIDLENEILKGEIDFLDIIYKHDFIKYSHNKKFILSGDDRNKYGGLIGSI
jgi:hypothetical protein